MKPKRSVKVRPSEAQEKDALPPPSEDYIVGQVANSLHPNKPTACGASVLGQLFSAPAAETQPVYVAAPSEKKRKHVEVEKDTEVQSSSTNRDSLKKVKKVKKKDLSIAEEIVANRERALDQADEEEEEKETQIKKKLKNKPSQLTKAATVKQKKVQISMAEEKLKNKRTLFVGNLPVSCTAQMLIMFFKEYGQIESIRFRSLIPAEDTLSRRMAAIKRKLHPAMKYINAYVVFKEESAANNALKCNGAEFASGFHIRVDLASKSSCHDNKRSVFVGNLPYDVDDETVRKHFSDCGNVIGVRIVRDRNTGIGKGFGYILFENTDSVHLALKLNNSDLKGRKLRVQRSVEKQKLEQKSLNKNGKNTGGLKHTKGTPLKNAKGSSNTSFAGEKAVPGKTSKKAKSKNVKKKLKKHK